MPFSSPSHIRTQHFLPFGFPLFPAPPISHFASFLSIRGKGEGTLLAVCWLLSTTCLAGRRMVAGPGLGD
jgi:hypothetical protein